MYPACGKHYRAKRTSTGLCKVENQKIIIGQTHTHIGQDSPLVYKHHTNWRLKSFERHNKLDADEIMFTAPISIAKSDIPKVRSKVLKFVEEIREVVNESDPEQVCCLNIDWFKVD